jgi:hypothetical protein
MWRKALTLVKSFALQRLDLLRRQLPVVSATPPPHALPHPSSTTSRLGNNSIVNARHPNVMTVSKPSMPLYKPGDKIQVKIMSFGPLGAYVDVIGNGHTAAGLIPESSPPLTKGLIYQQEITFFRQARRNVDFYLGEVLPAYVAKVRLELGGRLDVSLRMFGDKAKAEVKRRILERLRQDGTLWVGVKSTQESIAREFPGVSRSAFKSSVWVLYRQGLVRRGSDWISLIIKEDSNTQKL